MCFKLSKKVGWEYGKAEKYYEDKISSVELSEYWCEVYNGIIKYDWNKLINNNLIKKEYVPDDIINKKKWNIFIKTSKSSEKYFNNLLIKKNFPYNRISIIHGIYKKYFIDDYDIIFLNFLIKNKISLNETLKLRKVHFANGEIDYERVVRIIRKEYGQLKGNLYSGIKIEYLANRYSLLIDMILSDNEIKNKDVNIQSKGYAFELKTKKLFDFIDYQVEETPTSGDYGVDLIATDKKTKERIAVQCKDFSAEVGVGAIQEVVSGMAYYKCSKSVVVASKGFTTNAIELAKSTNTKLVSLDTIEELIKTNIM